MEDGELGALLTRLDERTARMDRALFGNGKQGLLADHIELRTEVRQVQSDLEKLVDEKIAEAKREVTDSTPSKGQAQVAKWSSMAALGTSIFIGIIQALTTVLKVP